MFEIVIKIVNQYPSFCLAYFWDAPEAISFSKAGFRVALRKVSVHHLQVLKEFASVSFGYLYAFLFHISISDPLGGDYFGV